jgi:hypothetical protein
MTGYASGNRPVPDQRRIGSAMTVETECVKAGLYSHFEVGALAAMTMDAGVESAAVCIVMVAGKAVHCRMFAVIEVQGQRHRTPQQRLSKSHLGTTRDERSEREHRGDDRAHDECRMPPERETARRKAVGRGGCRAARGGRIRECSGRP